MTAARDLLRQSRSETRGTRTVVSLLIFEVSSEIECMREVIQVILIGVNISHPFLVAEEVSGRWMSTKMTHRTVYSDIIHK